MNKKICRLCLQTISGNYETIEQSFNNTLKLNMDVSKEAVKCIECTKNLEMFIKLKSTCERTLTTNLKDNVYLSLNEIEITDDLISSMEFKNDIKCCFCTKSSGRGCLTSLNESNEHTFLMNVLKADMPKLNLNITEELLTCKNCLHGLQSASSFLMNCMNVEQNISKYTELKGTNDKGQIELEDVQQFIINPSITFEIDSRNIKKLNESDDEFEEEYTKKEEEKINIKSEPSDCHRDVKELNESDDELEEKYSKRIEAKIKREKDMENRELSIKTEEIVIKSEQSDYDSLQEPTTLTKIDKGSLDTVLELQRRYKACVDQHELTYTNSEGITIYKCRTCPYKTKHMSHIKHHELVHKKSLDITMFKCNSCPYEAKRQSQLFRHELTHRSISELKMFKCELCPYKTKFRKYLGQHKLIHKRTPELTMFKCELCPYKTKFRQYLIQHKLIHKETPELRMFKCELCPYKTKFRRYLMQHKLIHKRTPELKMFKCELCEFEAKCWKYVRRHKLVHKSSFSIFRN